MTHVPLKEHAKYKFLFSFDGELTPGSMSESCVPVSFIPDISCVRHSYPSTAQLAVPVHLVLRLLPSAPAFIYLSLLWAAGVGPSNRFAKLMSINSVILKVGSAS